MQFRNEIAAVFFNWLRAHRSAIVLVLVIAGVHVAPASDRGWLWVLGVTTGALVLLVRTRWCEMWRWHRTVRRYRGTFHKQILLSYDPCALDDEQATRIIATTQACLAELAAWHGFRLRGRVCVFVLPTVAEIQSIFGSGYHALAWPSKRAIVVPAGGGIDETIRHELSHLFSAKWNANALPLLDEGMATWWEYQCGKSATDAWGHYFVPHARLQDLLDPDRFYQQEPLHASYLLAGSFIGFLICRYGKERYRDLYRRATFQSFERCFYDCFGLTLAEAEARWRVEIATTQLLRQRLERALCY
jgi:hypothetical protein